MNGASELIDVGRHLQAAGMTWGSSGNLSLRTTEGFVMTASGSRLQRLSDDDILRVDASGTVLEASDERRPSKESGMHLAVYRRVAEATAVLHVSPPYTTYLSCSDLQLPADAFPEGMMHLGQAVRVPYRHAGSAELVAAVEERCTESQVLVLENHGALVWGASVDDALLKLEALEFGARLAALGAAAGAAPRLVPADQVRAFRSSGYRR